MLARHPRGDHFINQVNSFRDLFLPNAGTQSFGRAAFRHAHNAAHRFLRQPSVQRSAHIQHGKRVAHPAFRRAGNALQRVFIPLNIRLTADPLQAGKYILFAHPLKVILLTAG